MHQESSKSVIVSRVVLFATTGLFHDLATLDARLDEVHTATHLAEDAGLLKFLFVPAQCAVDAFAVFYLNQKHCFTYFL
jgi:hypothetical protein